MKELNEITRTVDKFRKDFESRLNYDQEVALHEIWKALVLKDNPNVFDDSETFNKESFDRKYKHVTYSPLNK